MNFVKDIIREAIADHGKGDVESMLSEIIEKGGMTVEEASSDLGYAIVEKMMKEVEHE